MKMQQDKVRPHRQWTTKVKIRMFTIELEDDDDLENIHDKVKVRENKYLHGR